MREQMPPLKGKPTLSPVQGCHLGSGPQCSFTFPFQNRKKNLDFQQPNIREIKKLHNLSHSRSAQLNQVLASGFIGVFNLLIAKKMTGFSISLIYLTAGPSFHATFQGTSIPWTILWELLVMQKSQTSNQPIPSSKILGSIFLAFSESQLNTQTHIYTDTANAVRCSNI